MFGWFLKMFACILYAWLIVYYYGYGDPLGYYNLAGELRKSVLSNFSNVKFFFQDAATFKAYISSFTNENEYLSGYSYYLDSNFIIHKICCFISFFTFNRFLVISFVFTNLSFIGFVIIYKTLKKIIGGYYKEILLACIFIPSCIFWSSGLAKEPICMLAMGVLFSRLTDLFIFRRFSFASLLLIIFYGYILLTAKNYIFICLLLGMGIWIFYSSIKRIINKNPIKKFFFYFFMIVVLVGGGYLLSDTVTGIVKENVADVISINLNNYRYIGESGGSLIDVQNIDVTSIGGILKFIPQAMANVFFRPWPWEISNVLMIFTVLENLFFMFLFVKVLFRTRLFTRNLFINKNFQVFAIIFSITLALIIGMTTFNFGTMVRYKTPFLPFWAVFLLILNKKLSQKKVTKKVMVQQVAVTTTT